MTEWIISSSVLIVVIAALRFILRGKISLRLQYVLWALVLIRLLVPVSFGVSSVSVMNAVPDTLPETIASIGVPADAYTLPEGVTPELSFPAAPESAGVEANVQDGVSDAYVRVVDWGSVALVVWLTGLSVVGLFLLVTNLRFSVRLKSDRRATDIAGYPLPVYVSGMVGTPCMFGLFHPAIYVTQEAQEDEKTLRHVLEHEATHYRHGDHIWAILRGVCLALHWYNPLVWLAASLSIRDAELACDEGTIKRIGEESRNNYGRSLVGLTCKKHTASTLLTTATTMTGSKKNIQERIVLIAKKPKMALYTLVAVVLVAAAAVGCTFTGASGADVGDSGEGTDAPSPSAASVTQHSDAYTIPLDGITPYEPYRVQHEPAVDTSDIAEILAEAESGGVKMLFYRARSGDIWGAWVEEDGNVNQFIQAYAATNPSGDESEFSVETFQGLFGHDGFVMGCPFGALYHVYDYYFFNADGDVERLAHCVSNHTVRDLDEDGNAELLYFSCVSTELRPTFYFQRDGVLYDVDVTALLYGTFLGWNDIQSDGSVSQDEEGPYLALTFRLGEEETEYSYRVRYTGSALVVEDIPESTFPADGEVWLVQREDYEVGLRNQGDQTEILLRRDGAVTVLGSAPSDSDTRYSLRSFDAIPELSGFVLENLTSYGWGCCWYYAVRDDSAVCFAYSFGSGFDLAGFAEDLDSDGQAELICNVTYNADGVRDVWVYRMKDGVPQVASVKDAMLNIPADKQLVHPASAAYDVNSGSVTFEYLLAGEADWRIETAPLDYDSLQFEDFNYTATW